MSDKPGDILLLLNAAEGLLQVGLVVNGQMTAWRECEAAGQGAERLIPTLDAMLEETVRKRGQIKRIACVRGPGGFTGIRLALTTAFGLSRAISGPDGQKPLLAGLDYLPLLAASALLETPEATKLPTGLAALWVLTHARRGQVNMQGFTADGAPFNEPETVSLSEAIARISHEAMIHPGPQALVGSGVVRNLEELKRALPETPPLPEKYNHPSPAATLRLAEAATYSHDPIEPLYLRPCDAEENLPGIAAGLGLDPEEAALALKRLQGRICAD